jgi:hypothetical protein
MAYVISRRFYGVAICLNNTSLPGVPIIIG